MKRNFFVMLALSAVFLVNSASAALVATYDPANGEVTFSDVSALVGLRINASDASLIEGAATNLDGAASGFFGVVNDSAPNFIEWGNLTGMTFADEFSGNIFPTGLLQTQIDAAYEAVFRSSAAPTVDVSFAITGGLGTTVPEPTTMVMAGLGIIGLVSRRRRS
ncbi:MAG TPA: hypothetical protein DHW22_13475 [Planctomycetaceae bacterium]|nr:hypothetical protein [Planctomycetaceae bacterium]